MSKFKPGDIVYDKLLPDEKGIVLGYTGSGKHVDILVRNYRHGYFQVNGLPEKDILSTGEQVDVNNIVNWFK